MWRPPVPGRKLNCELPLPWGLVCGRFAATWSSGRLAKHFGVDEVTPEAAEVQPSWNVAPSTSILAVLSRPGVRILAALRWGLVPYWSKSPATGARMINARAETLDSSAAYRDPLAGRRAIIPVDGFYEWCRTDRGRQPYYFCAPDDTPLPLAGLWERWKRPDGGWLLSATIVTTAAAAPVATIHDRMPVVLGGGALDPWLDCVNVGAEEAASLLRAPGTDLRHWPVDQAVNNAGNDGPELVRPPHC